MVTTSIFYCFVLNNCNGMRCCGIGSSLMLCRVLFTWLGFAGLATCIMMFPDDQYRSGPYKHVFRPKSTVSVPSSKWRCSSSEVLPKRMPKRKVFFKACCVSVEKSRTQPETRRELSTYQVVDGAAAAAFSQTEAIPHDVFWHRLAIYFTQA